MPANRAPARSSAATIIKWAGQPQADLYRADDLRVIETGQGKLNYEEPQTTPDGQTIWLRSSKVPLTGRLGETIGVLGVYDDITDRKLAVEALRQSEHKFHSLYSAMTEGVALHELVFDAQGKAVDYRLLDANPAFETILGIPRQTAVGRCAARSSAGFPSLINMLKWP